ncbi:MAG: hypothetical protein CVU39_20305 [Chloroflexi bacterium HGW-Chloroflexi-10]|nr:MAG: hypothetical protein CVU39_20305 [Chloroflexi bacterium HGW-Chloroflexi-10]
MESSEQEVKNDSPSMPRRWVIILIFAVMLAFLALLGWGLKNAQQGPITVGQRVPDFSMTTFDGKTYNTQDLKGKVVVLNFWASWCKPCEQEAAEIEEAWRYYKDTDQVIFLGIDYVDTETEAREYLNKFDITYPNGPDMRTAISQLFRIRGVPETYVIDRQGNLAAIQIGPYSSLTEIQTMIDSVLNQ